MSEKRSIQNFLNTKKQSLIHNPALRSIHHKLHGELLWHLNRRSFAGGLAIGIFCAFIPLPAQMMFAAILAIAFQVNFPIALIGTWISNPLTYGPLFYMAYKIGSAMMNLYGYSTPEIADHSFLSSIHKLGQPILIGCLVMGVTLGSMGYLFGNIYWRFMILRRYNRRKLKKLRS